MRGRWRAHHARASCWRQRMVARSSWSVRNQQLVALSVRPRRRRQGCNAHAGSRTRVTSMGGLYDAATLRALVVMTTSLSICISTFYHCGQEKLTCLKAACHVCERAPSLRALWERATSFKHLTESLSLPTHPAILHLMAHYCSSECL